MCWLSASTDSWGRCLHPTTNIHCCLQHKLSPISDTQRCFNLLISLIFALSTSKAVEQCIVFGPVCPCVCVCVCACVCIRDESKFKIWIQMLSNSHRFYQIWNPLDSWAAFIVLSNSNLQFWHLLHLTETRWYSQDSALVATTLFSTLMGYVDTPCWLQMLSIKREGVMSSTELRGVSHCEPVNGTNTLQSIFIPHLLNVHLHPHGFDSVYRYLTDADFWWLCHFPSVYAGNYWNTVDEKFI